jgi:uncharacterized protein (DUF427 family)
MLDAAMSVRVRDLLTSELDELRYGPTEKRIRAVVGDEAVVDSTRARLVWEPGRVVPSYAVPAEDVRGEIDAAPDGAAPVPADLPRLGDRAILDPRIAFAVHTAGGEPVTIRARDGREAAGFRLGDAALDGYVVLDLGAFDAWYEEDERNVSHPRDPFHRIDIVHSSRHVCIELDGETLAESSRPYLRFEMQLPARYYLPAEDVRMDLLSPSETRTACAYKGEASYWAFGDVGDVAWTYRAPLREASEVTDWIAFFNERVDVFVDGERRERPVTPWSRR